jgi:hypothetical protein
VGRFNLKGNEMAESKFTPGPWEAIRNPAFSDCWYIKANGLFLGHVVEENAKANAELMADAPALLEVLDTFYDCIDHEKLLPSQLDAYHRARELLAKHGG